LNLPVLSFMWYNLAFSDLKEDTLKYLYKGWNNTDYIFKNDSITWKAEW